MCAVDHQKNHCICITATCHRLDLNFTLQAELEAAGYSAAMHPAAYSHVLFVVHMPDTGLWRWSYMEKQQLWRHRPDQPARFSKSVATVGPAIGCRAELLQPQLSLEGLTECSVKKPCRTEWCSLQPTDHLSGWGSCSSVPEPDLQHPFLAAAVKYSHHVLVKSILHRPCCMLLVDMPRSHPAVGIRLLNGIA